MNVGLRIEATHSEYTGHVAETPTDTAGNPTGPTTVSTVSGAQNYTWTTASSDPRALQEAAVSSTNRGAACWWSNTSFTVNLTLTDSATHLLALYFLDWDNAGGRPVGRSEQIGQPWPNP